MSTFNISLLMVIAFLLLLLGIGIFFTRMSTSFREYILGNQELHTAPLVGTLLALIYGGEQLMIGVEQIYNFGLAWVFFMVLTSLLPYWVISWLALHMRPFIHNLSMSESIGRVYGKYPRLVTGLSNICFAITNIAIQVHVISRSISMCIDSVHPRIITLCAILILVVYARIGGLRIVTFTDIAYIFVFFIIIPFLAFSIFEATGKPTMLSILQRQQVVHFDKLFQCGPKQLTIFTLLLSSLVSSIHPSVIQKIYMSAHCLQASMVFFFTSFFSLFITFFIILIALYTFIAAPDLVATETWRYIIAHLSPIFKGFVVISLLTMAISTADVYLNNCCVMFSNDIVTSMVAKNPIPYDRQLLLAKITAFSVGIITIIVSFSYNDLFSLFKLRFDCFLPIGTAPFILAVLGFRSNSRTALIGMATGLLTILAWNKWIQPAGALNGACIAMISNGLAMIAAHYLLPKQKNKVSVQ